MLRFSILPCAIPCLFMIFIISSVCLASPDFELKLSYLFRKPEIRLNATCLAEKAPNFVWAQLRDESGRQTFRETKIELADGVKSASIAWSPKGLAPARYMALIWDSGKREILKATYITVPVTPNWVDNKIGAYTDSWVPKPWTPLKLTASPLQVSCWGRKYSFGPSGITSVQSQGEEILASPMVWKASVAGRTIDWKPESTTVLSKADGVITFTSSQIADGLKLTCKGRVEFDGLVKLDFQLKSTGAPVSIDSLILDIPYRKESATLWHYFPKVPVWYGGTTIDGINAGSVPKKDWSSVFIPHVWIGDEDRGMQWLCESDQYWKPADDAKAIELLPQSSATTLRLNLIGKTTLVDKPRNYTFGFEASPIKPLPADRHAWHYTHVGGCPDIVRDANRMEELGVKAVDTLTWTEMWAHPRPATQENVDLLHKASTLAHEKKMRMMIYYAFLLSDASPEFAAFNEECRIIDKNAYVCPGFMNDKSYAVCQNSVWADAMLAGMEQTINEFNLDGVYSDSMTCIGECSNQLHGCGYVGEDGKVHSTVEIFAVREFMKRVYRLFELREKKTGKQMMFIGHTSANILLPTLGFCTAYLDTEHLTVQNRPFRIPLNVFRAEFMGSNFGVPAQSLSYYNLNGGKGLNQQEMMAISLLHDTETPWNLEAMAPVWKIWDAFGMEDTKFLPYWKEWGWNAPDGVKVSAYSKPNSNEILVVAANLTEQEITGNLGLNRPIQSAVDAFTGKSVTVKDGKLVDTFPVWQVKIYRMKTVQ